ncbi:MAG: hypothetical protein JW910_22795, partial [Anaerolineae bacterium]|nr:hypothetical protein [Anaerolineae bacterium]
ITRARDFCAGTDHAPSERLVWEQGTAAPGLYAITITYRFDCAASGQPVPFTLTIAAQSRVLDTVSGVLTRPGDRYTIPFDYPPLAGG